MAEKKTKSTANAKAVKAAPKATKALKQIKEKAILSPEENLQKLAKSKLPMLFVKNHEGSWNHQDWLDFLEDIKARGYDPIPADNVGLILEEKKKQYLAAK